MIFDWDRLGLLELSSLLKNLVRKKECLTSHAITECYDGDFNMRDVIYVKLDKKSIHLSNN